MKVRSTKKALLSAVLSLVVCIAMLVGSTFAWFTDNVVSANNIIKSGNLDVSLEWMEGKNDPTDKDSTEWKDASQGAIFDYNLWEPGYTCARHIKIENEGSLALKYTVTIDATGEVSKLVEVIDVYYVDPAEKINDRTELTSDMKLGTLKDVLAGMETSAAGTLLAGKYDTITLVLKMQETAGNEYEDLAIGSSFAVKLFATQLASEKDSFGPDYDEGINNIGGVLYEKDGDKVVLTEITDDFNSSTLKIANGCTDIGRYALSGNIGADTIILPETVKNIEDYAFSQSTASTIILNEGLESIGNRAFQKNKSLTSITLPSTLETIEPYAFQGTTIKELTVPASVQEIGQAAFAYLPNVESITIQGNPAIGDGTGENNPGLNYVGRACPNLRTVYILGNPTYVNGGIIFSNTESGIAKDITVYFANQSAADAYKAATAYDDYTIVVMDQVNSAEELKASLASGKDVVLGGDVTVDSDIAISNADFVLHGNGHTIKMANTRAVNYALFDITGGKVTITDVTFDGIQGGAILRTVGAEAVIDNVTVQNCNHTQQQGLLRLLGKSTVKNSTFKNNKCTMAITYNYDASVNEPFVLKNSVFENNNCADISVVYYVDGSGATIDGNKFVGNTVKSAGNAATLYLGFTENNVVTNNVFKNNDVTTTGATTKRAAGAIMVGNAAKITNNAFVGNTVTAANAKGNDVCASVYYSDIDLSGNYWGGSAPVENDDYFVEYPDRYSVIINDYLTSYDF